ncbi:MAG: dihydrolipoyl dehydrogenase [Chloroflexota bacterium]
MTEQFDLAVLGGGPAGYVAALRAAQLGARAVVIEKERVGGTCLNIGCIPTKALTTSTELLRQARRAHEFGVVIPTAAPDLPALMEYKQRTVDALVGGVEHLLRKAGVALLRGTGRLTGPTTISVQADTGGAVSVSARRVILAPGSITARPPIPGLDLPGVMTSTGALDIPDVPAHLVVVGGGVIGLEFACIYEALDSRVTILEMMPTLLPGATDEALAQRLALLLRRRGMTVITGARVEAIASSARGLEVTYRDGKGVLAQVDGDRVLAAVGRWPNTAGLGLADIGVRMNGRAIAVDEHLATSVPDVWAVGDAVGGTMLAHKAMVDGRVAAENACGGSRTADHGSVPNVVFTRPEVASVGLTEAQARHEGADVKVAQFPFSANPRARILGETDGLVKLVCEAGSGTVLGVHILGPHATDLIAEGALAVRLGATADDLAWTTHAHPTLPEAVLEAALGFRDATLHFRKS